MNTTMNAAETTEPEVPLEVQCEMSGCRHTGHDLTEHIMKVHKITVEQYATLTNNAPLLSALGREELMRKNEELASAGGTFAVPRRAPARKAAQSHARVKKEYSIRDTFKIDLGYKLDAQGQPMKDAQGQLIKKDPKVWGFEDRTEHVPEIDPSYVFPVDETKIMLLGLQQRDNILLVGDTGTGKTSLVEQIAARMNYQVVKISFDGGISRNDLVGEHVIKGRETIFQYGILPVAMQMPGTIIIFDEWDTISAECSFVIQRPLQKEDRKMLLLETGGELISMHPDNVFVATANTAGQGDDSGLYSQGTKVQNYSQINRFSITIRMSYMDKAKEQEMLKKRFPELKDVECEALVKAVNEVRQAHANGELGVPLSPRDLINWADKYLRLGDAERAARYCFINRMSPEDANAVEGLIKRIFDEQ